jgi:DUF1680 family protein
MKTQNYLRLSPNGCTRKVTTVQIRVPIYMYMNDFDTVELHLYSVVTMKLDSVKH